jgi:hypothetical protein
MTPSDARFHGCQIAGAREPRKKKLSRKDAKADREWTRRKERRTADGRGYTRNIVSQCLGTKPGASDMGFDLELWNELTFGSQFLILPLYYGQAMLPDSLSVGNALMTNTAAMLTENARQFGGVVLEDGFANENPFAASSLEPPRFGALGKHPYPVAATYPAGQEKVEAMLNALLDLDDYSFHTQL